MRAFVSVRGGYESQLDDDERNMIRGLASDVVLILGSDVDRELDRRKRIAEDPFAAFEDQFMAIEQMVEQEGALDDPFGADHSPDTLPHDLPFDDALERLLPDMSEDRSWLRNSGRSRRKVLRRRRSITWCRCMKRSRRFQMASWM